MNTDKTLTIPGISNYQYIRVSPDGNDISGFAKIQSDGSFRCSFLNYNDEEYAFTMNKVNGQVNGNTLTIKKSSHVTVYKAPGFNDNVRPMASDAITITSINCLCVK